MRAARRVCSRRRNRLPRSALTWLARSAGDLSGPTESTRAQDEEMTNTSSDGGPPPRGWRLAGWHWVLLAVPLFLVIGAAASTALVVGLASGLVLGLLVLVVIAGGTAPVWAAGLLRGKEERKVLIAASPHARTIP